SVPGTSVTSQTPSEAAPAIAAFKRVGGPGGPKPKAGLDKGTRRKRPRLVFDRQAAKAAIASAETAKERATSGQNVRRKSRNPGIPAHAIA
ncbi:unnamed protein product, partial [Laminaria digitata]